jgi:hypothetical protein
VWWFFPAVFFAAGDLVLNEVLYDPPGPDDGHEFVEIFNPTSAPISLADLRLIFVNGADPSDPDELWVGEPAAVVAPGGFFVLGGDAVEERDRTIPTRLQNGDEAAELWRGGTRLDAVAWGTDLGLGEGGPVRSRSGAAIGRVPDGRDRGDNARDFRELPEPTPGRENLPDSFFSLARVRAVPVWREDAGPVRIRVGVTPSGWGLTQQGTLAFEEREVPLVASPGDTLDFEFGLRCEPGDVPVRLRLGTAPEALREVGPREIRCGVDVLVFTEVLPRPVDGEPEWIEILNRSPAEVDLAGWSIRDRGGSARRLADVDALAPGERVVFCADPERLRGLHPDSEARFLRPIEGWPSLNDSDPGGDVAADSLHLVRPDGVVVDLVTWSRADLDERGRSLQRGRIRPGQASIWMPSSGPAGPGEPSTAESRLWPESGLRCSPDPFSPDGDGHGDELEVLVVGEWSSARIAVFDLQGDLVRELLAVDAGSRHAAVWDGKDAEGRDLPPGAWVIVVDAVDRSGASLRMRSVVGLGRRP